MMEMFHSQQPDRQQLKEFAPTDLRVGLYVILNCSWFVHPFPTKNFQITSKAQIQTIRGLGMKSVTVDLGKSDPAVVKSLSNGSANGGAPASTPSPSAATPASGPESAAGDPPPVETVSPMEQYVKGLEKAEQALGKHLQNGAQFMKELSTASPQGFANIKQIVGDLGSMIGQDGNIGAILSTLNPEEPGDFNTTHAMNVCALSMVVGKHLKLEADKLRALGLGALYHDAGEGKLPLTIRKAQGQLTAEQQRQFEEHPILGIKLAAKDPGFPALAFTVIQEHHERLDGSGYPFGLKANKVSFLSQIVMVIDEYDELINPRDRAKAMAPAEALSHLRAQRQKQLSQDIVTALEQSLGQYPPGSIVELSDQSIGMVLSLGEPDRSRPTIILYEAAAPSDKPHMVDLASDTTLTINRAVPKSAVPPPAAQYLDFGHWASYFVRSLHGEPEPVSDEFPKAA